MNKRFFASLMLGFGVTLGVLVAVAMPPGGWGVAIGVSLGLLASIPLLIVLVMLLSRDHHSRRETYEEPAPQQIPVIIMAQPQPGLPYGGRYAQPEYELYNPEAYSQLEVPEGYEYYPQGYLAQPQPQPRRRNDRRAQPQPYQEALRPRSTRRRLQAGYYPDPNAAAYEQQYYAQPEAEDYYNQPQAAETGEAYDYYYEQPQAEYYEEPQAYAQPPRPSRRQRYAEAYEEEEYTGYYQQEAEVAPERRRPATPATRTRRGYTASVAPKNDEPIDAEFRTIGDA